MKNVIFRGLRIKVENPAGSVRSGVDRVTGKAWSTKMPYDYGEIVGSHGVDGDPVDVFIGPNKSAPFVHVVHQLNKTSGEWDEDKCFLGFRDAMDAKAAYYKSYDNPDLFYGSIESIPVDTFKQQVRSNNGETMIHASVGMGDLVTVDGVRGRGWVVGVDGDDVVVRYRSGIYLKRKKYFVHNMGDNMYKSRYQTLQAGGHGSGRHKALLWNPHLNPSDYKHSARPDKGYNIKPVRFIDRAAIEKFLSEVAEQVGAPHAILEAGGPGSGRKPGYGKGLNKWKSPVEETKLARVNPKQQSFFGPGHVREIQKKAKSKLIDAADLIQSPELDTVTVPKGLSKTIKKVGTNFCVVSNDSGQDRNFGCYGSREQAQAVLEGRSFIDPNVPGNLFAQNVMMPYGGGTTPRIKFRVPHPSLGKAHHGPPKIDRGHVPGVGARKPNPTMKHGKGVGHRFPNPSEHHSKKLIESFGDLGEPMAGALGHAHIEPELWFHPPSLDKRKRATRVPVDEPTETDNRFLDVTKRKKAYKDKLNILKRGAPGGLPALIPAHTTLLVPHTAAYQPAMGFSAIKAGRTNDKRMRVSFDRQGCI